MRLYKSILSSGAILAVAMLGACSESTKAPDVAAGIRQSLDAANLKDVSVSQDRDKGVVTLGGHVTGDGDRAQAESIAKSMAGSEVVANQIAVRPPGAVSETKTIDSDLDQAINKNLDAILIQNNLHNGVNYDVKNGVVTLTGEVRSQSLRSQTESVASSVPNVRQVVNELQVKNQRATSTN